MKDIELTDDQKKQIDELSSMGKDIHYITKKVFNNDELDGRNAEGKSVKIYILQSGGVPVTTKQKKEKEKKITELSKEQCKNIDALLESDQPPAIREIVKILWPEIDKVAPLSKEYQLVYHYVKKTNENSIDLWDETVDSKIYKFPATYSVLIGVVNQYVGNPHDTSKALYNPNAMKSTDEKNLKALYTFLKTTRFRIQCSQYYTKAERELFESTFIRFVHDKAADLTQEEVDMYIAASAETVQVAKIERDIQNLENEVQQIFDSSDAETKKISMSLVELLNSTRDKLDKSKKQLKSVIESVAGSRSKRIGARVQQNASVLNLLDAWIDEEKRHQLIALGIKEHEEDEKEFNRLSSMDDVTALIAGMSKNEAIGGI